MDVAPPNPIAFVLLLLLLLAGCVSQQSLGPQGQGVAPQVNVAAGASAAP